MLTDFDVKGLAAELGMSVEEVLQDLDGIRPLIAERRHEFVRNAKKRGKSLLKLDLLCLAWERMTIVREG